MRRIWGWMCEMRYDFDTDYGNSQSAVRSLLWITTHRESNVLDDSAEQTWISGFPLVLHVGVDLEGKEVSG